MVELTGMQQIATACADKTIRVWDIKKEINITPRKKLTGHNKAVRFLAYSYTFNLMISCGFEFEALV
jgi:FOG: WD40 repeat